MLMTDENIREAMSRQEMSIIGFSEECLEGATYDLRIGKQVLVSNTERVVDPEVDGPVRLDPGEFALLLTLERLKLAPFLAGNIGGKTYFTRKGLILLAGLQIDPGWGEEREAPLELAVYNSSPKSIVLEFGEKICSAQFFRLPSPVAKKIDMSRFRDLQQGQLPRVDKDFFRDLEARSLTEVQQDLRQLVRNVSSLTDGLDRMKEEVRTGFAELRRVVYGLLAVSVVAWVGLVVAVVTS